MYSSMHRLICSAESAILISISFVLSFSRLVWMGSEINRKELVLQRRKTR